MIVLMSTQKYFIKPIRIVMEKEEIFLCTFGYFFVLKNKKRKRKSGNYAVIIIRRDNLTDRIINQR